MTGCGIHDELHAEGQQETKVAVLGGEAGGDDPCSQAEKGHVEDEGGQQKGDGREVDAGVGEEGGSRRGKQRKKQNWRPSFRSWEATTETGTTRRGK